MSMSRCIFVACNLVVVALLARTFPVHAIEHTNAVENVVAPSATIIVYVSRSTNSCALRIAVKSGGEVIIRRCNRTRTSYLPAATVTKLFDDVMSALPLSSLPQGMHCMKSMSFGTATRIAYRQQISPDLSCSLDSRGKALYADVAVLIKEA